MRIHQTDARLASGEQLPLPMMAVPDFGLDADGPGRRSIRSVRSGQPTQLPIVLDGEALGSPGVVGSASLAEPNQRRRNQGRTNQRRMSLAPRTHGDVFRSEATRLALREAYRMRSVRRRPDKVRHGRLICSQLLAMLREDS